MTTDQVRRWAAEAAKLVGYRKVTLEFLKAFAEIVVREAGKAKT